MNSPSVSYKTKLIEQIFYETTAFEIRILSRKMSQQVTKKLNYNAYLNCDE